MICTFMQALPGIAINTAQQYARIMWHNGPPQWQLDAVAASFPAAHAPSSVRTQQSVAAALLVLNRLPAVQAVPNLPVIASTRTLAAILSALVEIVKYARTKDFAELSQEQGSQVWLCCIQMVCNADLGEASSARCCTGAVCPQSVLCKFGTINSSVGFAIVAGH